MPIYRDIYDGPPNGYTHRSTDKRYIVIHNTANDASAEDEASYAKRRTDSVSSHYYVDHNSIVQSLDTDYRAWHVGSDEGNDHGISYEITGTNGKSTSWWRSNVAWSLLAAQIAKDCTEHGIAPRTLTVDQIKDGSTTGIITHDQARRAWGYTTHTDPGPNFPMSYLVELLGGAEEPPPSTPSTPSSDWTQEAIMSMPTVDQGDRGRDVARAQGLLAANGYPPRNSFNSKGQPDGIFGDGTGDALAAFQEDGQVKNSVRNGRGDRICGRYSWTDLLGA